MASIWPMPRRCPGRARRSDPPRSSAPRAANRVTSRWLPGTPALTISRSAPPAAAPDEALGELVEWWSDLFVLPCLVEGELTEADCVTLARQGADLLGVQGLVWQHPAGPGRALGELRDALARG